MILIRLTLLAAALLYLCPTANAQEFKLPKNEIELSKFSFGVSKDFGLIQGGIGITYRRMLSNHFALQAKATQTYINLSGGEGGSRYLSGSLGLGAVYFFKPTREGLFVSPGLERGYLFDLTNSQNLRKSYSISTSLGFRADLGKNFYLLGGLDVNYNLTYKSVELKPNIGVGIRF